MRTGCRPDGLECNGSPFTSQGRTLIKPCDLSGAVPERFLLDGFRSGGDSVGRGKTAVLLRGRESRTGSRRHEHDRSEELNSRPTRGDDEAETLLAQTIPGTQAAAEAIE